MNLSYFKKKRIVSKDTDTDRNIHVYILFAELVIGVYSGHKLNRLQYTYTIEYYVATKMNWRTIRRLRGNSTDEKDTERYQCMSIPV